MKKRHALMLSAVLAATVLTGGAAVLGLASAPHVQAAPAAVVQTQSVQSTSQSWEEGD